MRAHDRLGPGIFQIKNDENGCKIKIPGVHSLASSGEGIGPPGGLAVVPAMKIDKFCDIHYK